MKSNLKNAGRTVVAVAIFAMGVYGYICYEKTLVAWWWPVVVAGLTTLLSVAPFGHRWQWLSGSSDRTLNLICHLYAVSLFSYFVLLAGNYHLTAASSAHTEDAVVLRKEMRKKVITQRSGRRYRNIQRTVYEYHFTLRFSDGSCKEIPVEQSDYNRIHTEGHCTLNLQKGLFGLQVIKAIGRCDQPHQTRRQGL